VRHRLFVLSGLSRWIAAQQVGISLLSLAQEGRGRVQTGPKRVTCAYSTLNRRAIVFVAVNDQGEPTPVTPWEPATDDEIAQGQYALQLMEMRSRIESRMNIGRDS
jgi:hypothetical protein